MQAVSSMQREREEAEEILPIAPYLGRDRGGVAGRHCRPV
jgi:hypothetical protein